MSDNQEKVSMLEQNKKGNARGWGSTYNWRDPPAPRRYLANPAFLSSAKQKGFVLAHSCSSGSACRPSDLLD
jgi:hypothetical protein